MSDKSRTVALLFSLFLGGFGAHRFYAGKNTSAIVMLVLTITLIGCIVTAPWALIDTILILCGKFTDEENLEISKW